MPVADDKTAEAATNNQHPLDDFWGTVADINDVTRAQRANPNKTNNFIVFDLNNLEIIKAREPYNFPTTQIELMEINIPGSQWEVFKESLRKCGFTGGLNNIISKRVHFKFADAIFQQRSGSPGAYVYANAPGFTWQIIEIDGVENTSNKLMEAICDIANGATAEVFKTNFMANSEIRTLTGFSDALVAASNNSLLGTMVASGKLTVDGNGIYSKV